MNYKGNEPRIPDLSRKRGCGIVPILVFVAIIYLLACEPAPVPPDTLPDSPYTEVAR